MLCNNRQDFIVELRHALDRYNVKDVNDILEDFGRHFEEGKAAGETEAQVCEKLGDTDEIARQYASEEQQTAQETPHVSLKKEDAADTPQYGQQTYQQAQQTQNAQQNSGSYSAGSAQGSAGFAQGSAGFAQSSNGAQSRGFSPDAGMIIGVICLDLFLLSWALPALASLIVALASVTLTLILAGFVTLILGSVSGFIELGGLISTGFSPISCIFLGILLMSLGGMALVGTVGSFRGFINLCIGIINLHARIFTGHDVLDKWKTEAQLEREAKKEEVHAL